MKSSVGARVRVSVRVGVCEKHVAVYTFRLLNLQIIDTTLSYNKVP